MKKRPASISPLLQLQYFLCDVSTRNGRSMLKESIRKFDRSTNALAVCPPARDAVAAVDVFSATSVLSRSETYLEICRIP